MMSTLRMRYIRDSASVAEIICVLSALSKKGANQNIAVTGSINQFGDVQPIGGVNEKIEGFFKVCNMLDTIDGKGVLIPEGNKDEVILKAEVENALILHPHIPPYRRKYPPVQRRWPLPAYLRAG